MTTHVLELPEVDLTYDVHGPLPTADGRPPLVMIGQPMDASGFARWPRSCPTARSSPTTRAGWAAAPARTAASTIVPRSRRTTCTPSSTALGAGPVEMFASSGGAVTALALVAAHPDDVITLVAHEPPLVATLPDAAAAERARPRSATPTRPRAGAPAWRRSSR